MKKLIFLYTLIINLVYCMEQADAPSDVSLSCQMSGYNTVLVKFNSSGPTRIEPFLLEWPQQYCPHSHIPLERPLRTACEGFKYTNVDGCISDSMQNDRRDNIINLVCIRGPYRIVFKLHFRKSAQDCCMLLCTVLAGLKVFCKSLQNFEAYSQPQHTVLEKISTLFSEHSDLNEILKIFELGCALYKHIKDIKGTSDRFKNMYGLSFDSFGIYLECERTRRLCHVDDLTIGGKRPEFGLYLDLGDLEEYAADDLSGYFAWSPTQYYSINEDRINKGEITIRERSTWR